MIIMKQLHFDYKMNIGYSEDISTCNFTIKCIPATNARQRLLDYEIVIMPEHLCSYGFDSFGNHQVYGSVNLPHDYFNFHISGDVLIDQILYEEKATEEKTMLFRHPYGMNRAGEELKKYYEGLHALRYENEYERAVNIMHNLHKDYTYKKGNTGVNTTAEEAWALKGGVCQDYAHIFIALCHMAGIPARYVTGMIVGEGASHAWAEIMYHNKWIGMDPTNDLLISDSQIKLGHGRDASDCQINRGIMHGGGEQKMDIEVSVENI